jgi:hypothetical protein
MSNQVIERKPNGQYARGSSGNLGGNAQRTRHMFSKAFVEALLEDFREWGPQAIARVRTETPAAYLRVCAMLVPKELKLEHSQVVKALSDEELEAAIAVLRPMVAAHMQRAAKSLPALPAPDVTFDKPRRLNKIMDAAETAAGPRGRMPRKVPSPTST